jgi:hypothetical protein
MTADAIPAAEQWFTVPGDRLRHLADAALASVIIRPGDTLVVAMPGADLTPAQLARLKTEAKAALPGVEVLIIGGATALATYRPEDT